MQTAKKVLLIGLAMQVITFGIFMFVAIAYDVRTSRAGALVHYDVEMKRLRPLWTVFYVVSVLITLRSIYRTIGEYLRYFRLQLLTSIRRRICFHLIHCRFR